MSFIRSSETGLFTTLHNSSNYFFSSIMSRREKITPFKFIVDTVEERMSYHIGAKQLLTAEEIERSYKTLKNVSRLKPRFDEEGTIHVVDIPEIANYLVFQSDNLAVVGSHYLPYVCYPEYCNYYFFVQRIKYHTRTDDVTYFSTTWSFLTSNEQEQCAKDIDMFDRQTEGFKHSQRDRYWVWRIGQDSKPKMSQYERIINDIVGINFKEVVVVEI